MSRFSIEGYITQDDFVQNINQEVSSIDKTEDRVNYFIDAINQITTIGHYRQEFMTGILDCIHRQPYVEQVAIFLNEKQELRYSEDRLNLMCNVKTAIFLLHLSLSGTANLEYTQLKKKFKSFFREPQNALLSKFVTRFDEFLKSNLRGLEGLERREILATEVVEFIRSPINDESNREELTLPSPFLAVRDQLPSIMSQEGGSALRLQAVLNHASQVIDPNQMPVNTVTNDLASEIADELKKVHTSGQHLFVFLSFVGGRLPDFFHWLIPENFITSIQYGVSELLTLGEKSEDEIKEFRQLQHQLPGYMQYLMDGIASLIKDDFGIFQEKNPIQFVLNRSEDLLQQVPSLFVSSFAYLHALVRLGFAAKNWLQLNEDLSPENQLPMVNLQVRLAALLAACCDLDKDSNEDAEKKHTIFNLRSVELKQILGQLGSVQNIDPTLRSCLSVVNGEDEDLDEGSTESDVETETESEAKSDSGSVLEEVEQPKISVDAMMKSALRRFAAQSYVAEGSDRAKKYGMPFPSKEEIREFLSKDSFDSNSRWVSAIFPYLDQLKATYDKWCEKGSVIATLYQNYFRALFEDESHMPGHVNYRRMNSLAGQRFYQRDASEARILTHEIDAHISVRKKHSCEKGMLLPSDNALFCLLRFQIAKAIMHNDTWGLLSIKEFCKQHFNLDLQEGLNRIEKALQIYKKLKRLKEKSYDKGAHKEHHVGSAKWTITWSLVHFFERSFGLMADKVDFVIDPQWEDRLSILLSFFSEGTRIRYQAQLGYTSRLRDLLSDLDKLIVAPVKVGESDQARLWISGELSYLFDMVNQEEVDLNAKLASIGYLSYLLQYAINHYPDIAINCVSKNTDEFESLLYRAAICDAGLFKDLIKLVSNPAVYFNRDFENIRQEKQSIFHVLCLYNPSAVPVLLEMVNKRIKKKSGWLSQHVDNIQSELFFTFSRIGSSKRREIEGVVIRGLEKFSWKVRARLLLSKQRNLYFMELPNAYKELPFSYFIDCLYYAAEIKNRDLIDLVNKIWGLREDHYREVSQGSVRVRSADQGKHKHLSIDLSVAAAKELEKINSDSRLGSEPEEPGREALDSRRKKLRYFLQSSRSEHGAPVCASLYLMKDAGETMSHDFTFDQLLSNRQFLHNLAIADPSQISLKACVRLIEGLAKTTTIEESGVKLYFIALINNRQNPSEKLFLAQLYVLALAKINLQLYLARSFSSDTEFEKKEVAKSFFSLLIDFFSCFEAPTVVDMTLFKQAKNSIRAEIVRLKQQVGGQDQREAGVNDSVGKRWQVANEGVTSQLHVILRTLTRFNDDSDSQEMPRVVDISILRGSARGQVLLEAAAKNRIVP